MDIIQTILKYGLSIRQIPHKTVENWRLLHNQTEITNPEPNATYKILWSELTEITPEQWNKRRQNGFFVGDNYMFENGIVYRRVIRVTRIPKNAGYWMCKQTPNTNSEVHWDTDIDNLAPTLEESINLFIKNIAK